MSNVRKLHWGCGWTIAPGWINSDIMQAPGIDISCDIRKGIPLESDSIDYIVSHHALNELKIYEQVPAIKELHRILKPGGVVRMSLPDMDKMIAAYQRGDQSFFFIYDWETLFGNFITHLLWYNGNQTPFTYLFAEELFRKAGFTKVQQLAIKQTASPYPDITDLDGREHESFFIEATKQVSTP